LLFIISKGREKSGSATRAMQFASLAAQQGSHVPVFFIDEAVHWAQMGMAEGIRAATGESLKDFLDFLTSHRHPVQGCKACADKRLISPDDLVQGAVISPAPVPVQMMARSEYKVFTF